MAVDDVADKRARLLASKSRWSGMNDVAATHPLINPNGEKCTKDSIQHWLISITEEDAKPDVVQDAPVPLKRNASSEDDLALGTEASLYGKPAIRTAQGFLRSSIARPPLPRWSSLTSAFSACSGPLSVMDVLNLWQDDPEELLLDLGFGAEEPDITVRIPARFINHQSKARGINIQLFLEAQKNRMDIENPDVSNRFRQLEVLQQVTTAFNSLIGGSTQVAEKPREAQVSAETKERRKRVGMLLRKASKKSLSQAPTAQDHQPLSPPLTGLSSSPDLPADPPHDKRSPVKRARQSLPDSASLSPLVEEQSSVPETAEPTLTTPLPQCQSISLRGAREPHNIASTQRSPEEPAESFELEEIQSFDEGSIAGSCTSPTDHLGNERACLSRVSSCVLRTNSCQSDSSGFLEEPIVPAFSQHPGPGPELMKVLNAMSEDSTDSQQKSVEQEQTEFHSSDPQSSSESLLVQTESLEPHSNIESLKEMTQSKLVISEEVATESYLQDPDRIDMNAADTYVEESTTSQDIDQVDYLVDMNVAQKDIADENVGETTRLQDTGQVDCLVNTNVVQKVTAEYCTRECTTSQDTGQVVGLVDMNITQKDLQDKESVEESTSSYDTGQVSCLVDVDLVQKDIAEDFIRENTTSQDTDQVDCLLDMSAEKKDLTENYTGESTRAQNSPNPPPDVVPEGDSWMKVLKSDYPLFNTGSSPSDITEPEIASSTEANETNTGALYSGHSVSVQMPSSLAYVSQSSLSGSRSHSPSLGPTSPSRTQHGRQSFFHRVHSDVDNPSDPLSGPTTHTPSELVTPSPQCSQESSRGLWNFRLRSTSLEMGTSDDEDRRWEGALWAGAQCCCSCDHNCGCCCKSKSGYKQHSGTVDQLHTAFSLPYSLDELEGMMRCMRKFRRVLSEIEKRLEEEQTSVLSSLSDAHRAEVQDVLELRTAVKQEAVLLEQQLTDLVHAYDDNIKMKLNRLLDEQSQLCSQLQIIPSDTPHSAHISMRSVAIQCCLLPMMDTTQPGLFQQATKDANFTYHDEWSPGSKADKLDFVGFIKSLKDVSISNDSLE
ncbi:protein ITPRID1 isoform X2 [Pygocentrus nattereri]|uniref:protein ITPRID1 isoform X2 n=1 Tax=Pygocentrus nattereri TaxID=42514 RepID=UPI0008148BC0|nr:protein ITPRID1 isoform X2 [Pygocentrus nattereri]